MSESSNYLSFPIKYTMVSFNKVLKILLNFFIVIIEIEINRYLVLSFVIKIQNLGYLITSLIII